MTHSDIIDIEVRIHHRTTKAVLVSSDGSGDHQAWLPLSVIEIDESCAPPVVTLPMGVARDKGLI